MTFYICNVKIKQNKAENNKKENKISLFKFVTCSVRSTSSTQFAIDASLPLPAQLHRRAEQFAIRILIDLSRYGCTLAGIKLRGGTQTFFHHLSGNVQTQANRPVQALRAGIG